MRSLHVVSVFPLGNLASFLQSKYRQNRLPGISKFARKCPVMDCIFSFSNEKYAFHVRNTHDVSQVLDWTGFGKLRNWGDVIYVLGISSVRLSLQFYHLHLQ